jgi:uncharacterized membrane protein YfhO
VRIVSQTPDGLTVEVFTEQPGILVMAINGDPGWRASLDGESTHLYRANFLDQAVVVPGGRHVVELRYESVPLKIGALISGLTVLVIAVIAIREWRAASSAH